MLIAYSTFSSVQLLSHVWLFATPWTTACQASLYITKSQSLPKPMSIESVMPSNHLILCRPFLFLPSIFPSIRVFSNESALCIRWPKYWSFSFSISPSSEHPGLISFRMDWLDLLAVQGTLKSLQHHSWNVGGGTRAPTPFTCILGFHRDQYEDLTGDWLINHFLTLFIIPLVIFVTCSWISARFSFFSSFL